MTAPASSLKNALWRFLAQAHDCEIGQLRRFADAQARFELRLDVDAMAPKRRLAHVVSCLRRLQIAGSQRGTAVPLRRKDRLVAALPDERITGLRAPVLSSAEETKLSDAELAEFIHTQWVHHYDQAREHRLEVFCHPKSANYGIDGEAPGRSEWGVVSLHLSEILLGLYSSPKETTRAAAATFRRCFMPFNWDDYTPTEAAPIYRPEAYYVYERKRIDVYFPMAFYWNKPKAIAEFLGAFRKRMRQSRDDYELWCPGLVPYQEPNTHSK